MSLRGLGVAAGFCLAGAGVVHGAASQARPQSDAKSGPKSATLVCEAVYLPARSVWTRTVDIGYDGQRVRSVRIDGQQVYTFAIEGALILTSQDNERIRIDTASPAWSSDFRGLASAHGLCVWGP